MRAPPVVQLCIFYVGLWPLLSLAYARWVTDIMGAIESADPCTGQVQIGMLMYGLWSKIRTTCSVVNYTH